MRSRLAFGIKTLISCTVFNSMLLVAFFLVIQRLLTGFHQWFDPFAAAKEQIFLRIFDSWSTMSSNG